LTGECSFFGGLLGAMMSGWITAYKVVGLGGMLKAVWFREWVECD